MNQQSRGPARRTFALIACALAALPCAGAQTVTLSASKDNTLYQESNASQQLSNGQGSYLFAGRTKQPRTRRALIAFDLSSIPANATITGVTLTLFASKAADSDQSNVSLHKVTRDWGEGGSNAIDEEGGGAAAQSGDATWLFNFFNTSSWTTPGGDFASASSATTAVGATGRTYTWSGSGMVGDVQTWIASPGTNFGWAILGNENSAETADRFNSSENSSNPPTLTVTYQTPAASPSPSPSPSASPSPSPGASAAPQLLNISTRLRVQTGDDALIGGFIIGGNQPKRVILRAIGPSLVQRGVADALADPVLELRAPDGSILMANDNWRENQQIEIQNSGVAPENDLEAAIVATLPAGNAGYTGVVRGKNNTTGVGLIEAYDLERAADSRLANISTRGLVQTGTNVMIGGFIIGGDSNARVIVRAIGPSLSQSGVPNPLANPTLELFDANGNGVEANDNWRDDPDQAEIAAAGVAPQNDLESALLVTIPPGDYTAIVAGQNSGTGVGLVEVYHLR